MNCCKSRAARAETRVGTTGDGVAANPSRSNVRIATMLANDRVAAWLATRNGETQFAFPRLNSLN